MAKLPKENPSAARAPWGTSGQPEAKIVVDADSPGADARSCRRAGGDIAGLKDLLVYLYSSKVEVNARAQTLVSANALFTGLLAVAATIVTATRFPAVEVATQSPLFTLLLCGAGTCMLASQVLLLLVHAPIVLDATTPLEPTVVSQMRPEALAEALCRGDSEVLEQAYARECVAVAKVQVRRAGGVSKAILMQCLGIGFVLAASAVLIRSGLLRPEGSEKAVGAPPQRKNEVKQMGAPPRHLKTAAPGRIDQPSIRSEAGDRGDYLVRGLRNYDLVG